jgi:hypothetical protein
MDTLVSMGHIAFTFRVKQSALLDTGTQRNIPEHLNLRAICRRLIGAEETVRSQENPWLIVVDAVAL